MTRTVVLKVGGSLFPWDGFPGALRRHLDGLATERVVVVAGGGRVVDQIRALDSVHGIGENRSHGLALRALDLTAHLTAGLVPGLQVVERPEALPNAWREGLVPVLSPRWFMENVDRLAPEPLPETWEVTTDSIAARLAELLRADELRLLKSTGLNGPASRSEAAAAGLVDPWFERSSRLCPRVTVVNLRAEPGRVEELDAG